jgi:plastocyanin
MRSLLSLAVVLGLAAAAVACSQPAGSNAPQPSAEGVVNVDASEYRFDPATISVPAGAVTFRVRNVGSVEHEFEVFKGTEVVDEIEGLVPGLVKDLAVTLETGAYTYVCKLAGHEEAGMTGTLTVTGG